MQHYGKTTIVVEKNSILVANERIRLQHLHRGCSDEAINTEWSWTADISESECFLNLPEVQPD